MEKSGGGRNSAVDILTWKKKKKQTGEEMEHRVRDRQTTCHCNS